jgi:FkbM family methyltransferase
MPKFTLRSLVKSCIVLALGRETRPRKIMRGLASGYWICVSPVDHLAYLLGTSEPHLQRIIEEHVAPGDTVYDIGANIGYVSLSLAKCVGPPGHIIAFEPAPKNADDFRESIKINRLANVQLLEFAASDQSGEALIRIAGNLSTAKLSLDIEMTLLPLSLQSQRFRSINSLNQVLLVIRALSRSMSREQRAAC